MHKLLKFIKDDKKFFESCKNLIRVKNNRMLIDGCAVYALVLVFYTFFAAATNQPPILRRMYYIYDIIHLLLCISVFARTDRLRESLSATQVYCALLELSLLSFFALEGAFASKTQHSLYVPIAILLVQLLFTHRVLYNSFVTLFYVAVFAILSRIYKTAPAYINDFYIAVATFISASIGYALVAKMRHNEGQALIEYETLSRIDMLTGMYNKVTCEKLCGDAISRGRCNCALLILDLDNFKQVNDTYGHDVGDEVLRRVSVSVKEYFCHGEILGRFGGDEFIVLMNLSDIDDITPHLQNLTAQISQLTFAPETLEIHCSTGVALSRKGDSFASVFKRADRALYTAKSNGKNSYFIDET